MTGNPGGIRRSVGMATIATAALLLAACGNTVQKGVAGSHRASSGSTRLALGSGGSGGSKLGAGGSGSLPGAVASPTGTSSAGTSGTASNLGPGTASAGPGAPEGLGGSAQATGNRPSGPIEMGFLNLTAANAGQYGINEPSGHTSQQTYQAIVDAINGQGGLDGRKIIPIYANVSLTGDWSSDYQAACATFTQDNHVAAVVGYSLLELESFEACLTKAGVVHLNAGSPNGDDEELQSNPYMFMTAYPTANGVYLTQLVGAVATGVLAKATKIGVLRSDCAWDERAWNSTAQPFISSHGLNVVKTDILSCPSNATGAVAIEQAMPNYVLQFRTAGAEVVLGDGFAQYFADAAQNQGYYPRYVITTVDTSEGLQTQNVPASQLKNMYGFGWYPILDADMQHQPPVPAPQSAVQQRCLSLFRSKGYLPTTADYQQVYDDCDTLFLYAQALQATAGRTDATSVGSAIAGLGSSHISVNALDGRTLFSIARHVGPDAWQPFGWNTGCSCFVYTGQAQSMPAGA